MATTIEISASEAGIAWVGDLPTGTCYEKEGRYWVKHTHGYSMALDNFKSYQVRSTECAERVFSKMQIILTERTG